MALSRNLDAKGHIKEVKVFCCGEYEDIPIVLWLATAVLLFRFGEQMGVLSTLTLRTLCSRDFVSPLVFCWERGFHGWRAAFRDWSSWRGFHQPF